MTIFFPPHQERLFVIMLVFGMLCGVIYDAFSIKRRLFFRKNLKAILFVDDFCFVLICAFLFLLATFIFNNGIIRWFELLFSLIGFLIYKATISKLILPFCFFICDLLRSLILKLLFIFLLPVKMLFFALMHLTLPIRLLGVRLAAAGKIYLAFRKFI